MVFRKLELDGAPEPRTGHGMVYDSGREVVVLFGGIGADGALGDTWELDATSWRRRRGLRGPPARTDHAMTYDPHRRRVIVFGGADEEGALVDGTWELDGERWEEVGGEGPSPPNNPGSYMVYHDAIRRAVLFSGGETWCWDGLEWEALPIESPAARVLYGMAYDARRKVTVMHGGVVHRHAMFSDTWEFDGSSWQEAYPAAPIDDRYTHSMSYLQSIGKVVIYGGEGGSQACNEPLLLWDGERWDLPFMALERNQPICRWGPKMVPFDPARLLVVFGGQGSGFVTFNDTWVLQSR